MWWNLTVRRHSLGAVAAGIFFGAAGCSGGGDLLGRGDKPAAGGSRVVQGGSQQVGNATVVTYATIGANNVVEQVGATVPMSVIQNPPASGSGPAGAFVVLPYPAEVKSTTFFDHFEMHWNPHGHDPKGVYEHPHFDFHFFGVPVQEVWQITEPDHTILAPERIPANYVYPGAEQTVLEMGTHALPAADLEPGAAFTVSMIVGYCQGELTMVEPMITQAWLLQKQSRTMEVPRPAVLGRATRYPTRVSITYNRASDAYEFVFSDFVTVTR